ncbi:MAG: 4-hydroxy-tetrahydrodipicolinate reductase [candidate division WOR-3 bacterium]
MKIAIVGYGKMGELIEKLAKEQNFEVTSTIDPFVSSAKFKELNKESLFGANVAIDFSVPEAVPYNIEKYITYEINAVVGTTGWYEHLKEIQEKVEKSKIGVIWSGNFSLGVNIFFRMIRSAAELMDKFPIYDIMGFELHHKRKKDSPSGTMNMIGEILLDSVKRKKKIVTEKLDRKISEEEIHLASVRGGSIPGTHVIIFDSDVDTIELKHIARSREGFAVGALKAAEWINGKRGFFSIDDMMNEIIGG